MGADIAYAREHENQRLVNAAARIFAVLLSKEPTTNACPFCGNENGLHRPGCVFPQIIEWMRSYEGI